MTQPEFKKLLKYTVSTSFLQSVRTTADATYLKRYDLPGNFEVMARPGYFAYAIIHGDNMEVSVHDGLLS